MHNYDMDRRTLLKHLAALGLLTSTGTMLSGCDRDGEMPMMGGSSSGDPMMNDGMMDPSMMGDMATIHELLANHAKIRRSVDDIDGGIRSATTSDDPHLAALIAGHVAGMRARLADNRPIRQGDPLFREIFKHHADITISVEQIPGGVQVTETSANPQVQLLIRQHARAAVSQFVQSGMSRAMQPTPLPDGYRG